MRWHHFSALMISYNIWNHECNDLIPFNFWKKQKSRFFSCFWRLLYIFLTAGFRRTFCKRRMENIQHFHLVTNRQSRLYHLTFYYRNFLCHLNFKYSALLLHLKTSPCQIRMKSIVFFGFVNQMPKISTANPPAYLMINNFKDPLTGTCVKNTHV